MIEMKQVDPTTSKETSPLTKESFEEISLTWNNISYTVTSKKTVKTLLEGMSGMVKSGEVVAIMGGSGAGKSTLLNVLAGRIGTGEISGEILVNGSPRKADSWRKLCAYVEQDDMYFFSFKLII